MCWLEFDGVLVDVCLREIYAISVEAGRLRRSTKGAGIDLNSLIPFSTTVPLTSPILSCNESKTQRQISAGVK